MFSQLSPGCCNAVVKYFVAVIKHSLDNNMKYKDMSANDVNEMQMCNV